LVPFLLFVATLPFGWKTGCDGGTELTGFDVLARQYQVSVAYTVLLVVGALVPIALLIPAVRARGRGRRIVLHFAAAVLGIAAMLGWLIPAYVAVVALGAVALEAMVSGFSELFAWRAERGAGKNGRTSWPR
jgi:hypothetical protein